MKIEVLNDLSSTDKFCRFDLCFLALRLHPEAQVSLRELAFRITLGRVLFEGPVPLQHTVQAEDLKYTPTREPVAPEVDLITAFAQGVPSTTFVDAGSNLLDAMKHIVNSGPRDTPTFHLYIECRATTQEGLVATAMETIVIENPWAGTSDD